MIITTNILALPLLLIIWVLEVWIALLTARLALQHVSAAWAGRAVSAMAPFIDGLLEPAHRWTSKRWPNVSQTIVGSIVLLSCVILRLLMIRLVMAMG